MHKEVYSKVRDEKNEKSCSSTLREGHSPESLERKEAFHESLFQLNKDLIQSIFEVNNEPQKQSSQLNKSFKKEVEEDLTKSPTLHKKHLVRSVSEAEEVSNKSPSMSRRELHRSSSECPRTSDTKKDLNKVLPKFLAKNYSQPLLAPPHQFAIHTYHKATTCDECGNFLVGMQRQGLNCRSCGMNVHEMCRRLIDNTRRPCGAVGAPHPKKTTFSLGKFLM